MTVALRSSRGCDLAAAALYELLRLRVEVFVVEQNCPYRELDGLDLLADTRHFWLESAPGGLLAAVRLTAEKPSGRAAFRISRVCTARAARGHGHSARLLRAALAEVGDRPCRLNAQSYLTRMYAGHGFDVDGEEFLEDGIPHVPMLRAGP